MLIEIKVARIKANYIVELAKHVYVLMKEPHKKKNGKERIIDILLDIILTK